MKGQTGSFLLVILIVGLVITFVVFAPPPHVPIHPPISIDPEPSQNDISTLVSSEVIIEGGGHEQNRLAISTEVTSFATYGNDLCIYGNFTVSGDGDGLIDFLILTDNGYSDFMNDGAVDNPDWIFNETYDTSGFYWEFVLPSEFNGHSVGRWYVVYSAFRKPSGFWLILQWIPPEYRDVTAETYRDLTAPSYFVRDVVERIVANSTLEIEVCAWDDRCATASVAIQVNGTSVATWTGRSEVFNQILVWDTTGFEPGNYSLTVFAQDEVGNWRVQEIGFVLVFEPQPLIVDPVPFILPGIGTIALLLVLCTARRELEFIKIGLSGIGSINIVNIIQAPTVYGPLEWFGFFVGICSLITFFVLVHDKVKDWMKRKEIEKERRRYELKGEPDYFR
ncbi:MAG: hypothetical protein ACE5IO_01855 [Thermoplasmata archaeon]